MDELRSQVSQERKQVGIVIMMMTMMVVVVMIVIILMMMMMWISTLIFARDDMSAFSYC